MMMNGQTIDLAQFILFGLILVVGFLLGLRTGRILPGLVFCWAMLTFQAFILSYVGARLAMVQDNLCRYFPEGPDFVAYGLIAGWVYGLAAAGSGKIVNRLRNRRSRKIAQNQVPEDTARKLADPQH